MPDLVPTISDLGPAVDTIVNRCLAIRPGEETLVVVDRGTRAIGEALRDAAAAAGSDAVLTIMEPRAVDGNEPPRTIAAALAECDVFIAPTTRSISHTVARKRASEAGARGATMPGVTEDMLARVMAVDFELMAARSSAAASLLTEADEARIWCARGTDFTVDLTGRGGIADDGRLTERGAFGNLPPGEGFIAPLGGEGRIVVAGTLAPFGAPAEPVTLTVEGGRLVAARGDAGADFIRLLRDAGEQGTNLAELGVGTNDRAMLTGNVLEDEKVLGTIHVAFGASAGIGGTVSVPVHLDVVVVDPTLDIGGTRVLDQGRFVLDAQ
jgi:leucyl aminopeptidase (aminopeptidase T)